MTLITILLAIIALSEITRLVLTHKNTTKKLHFRQKIDGVLKMIWDLEFKAFKTKEIREDVRKEYDNVKSRIEAIKMKIANWPKDQSEGDKKREQDAIEVLERDCQRYQAQMQALDVEVNGAKPSAENHDGVVGITSQVESLRELIGMLKDHIKTL